MRGISHALICSFFPVVYLMTGACEFFATCEEDPSGKVHSHRVTRIREPLALDVT